MNDVTPRPPSPVSRRRLGVPAWRLVVVALVLSVLVAVGTAPGLRVVLRALAPTLGFSALEGSLLDGVTLRDLRFVSSAFKLAAAEVSLTGRVSLHAGLALREVRARQLVIELPQRREGEARRAARMPLPLRVDALRVDDLAIVHGARRYEFATLDAAFDASATAWSLREFALRGERQRLDGHARYEDHRLGATIEGQMMTSSGEARAAAKLDGPLDALRLELELRAPLALGVRGELDALATPPRFKGALTASVPTLGALRGELDGDLGQARLRLEAPLAGAAPALRDAALDLYLKRRDDGVEAALTWQVGQAPRLQGNGELRWQDGGLRVALDSVAPTVGVRARLLPAANGAQLGARLHWQDLAVPVAGAMRSSGALKVRGTLDALFVSGALRGRDTRFGDVSASLHGHWQGKAFELGQLEAHVLDGKVHARGSFDWRQQACARLAFDFRRLDFGQFDAAWASRLEGLGRAHACRGDGGWLGGLALQQLGGRWREQPLSAHGELQHDAGVTTLREFELRLAGNTLTANLELGERLSGRFSVQAPKLAVVLPSLAGSLAADGVLGGTRVAPSLRATVAGSALSVAAWRAEGVSADIDVDAARLDDSHVSARLSEVMHGARPLGELTLQGRGSLHSHALSLAVHGKTLDAELEAQGAWQAPRWAGSVTRLTLAPPRVGEWQLESPAALAWQRGDAMLGPACLLRERARLCLDVPRWNAARGAATLTLTGLPLSLARAWMPGTLLPSGTVMAEARLERADGAWRGNGELRVERGRVRYRGPTRALEELPLRDARASFSIDEERLRANATLALGQWLSAEGRLDAALAASGAVEGELEAELPDIHWLEEFWPELGGSSGAAQLRASLRGPRDAARIDGTLRLSSGTILLPRFGTQFGQLEVAAQGVLGQALALRGEARLGSGTLNMDGEFHARDVAGPRARLHLRGSELALVRLPDIEADAAPDLTMTLAPGLLALAGQVTWSRVQILMPALPERAVATSSDVVLVNAGEAQGAAPPRPRWFVDTLAADLDLTLGDEVALAAAGLDAKLNGAVHWRKPRGEERGSGRGGLNVVDGHYKAYGQALKIQRGALIFDGAIDNPALEVRAIRADLEDVVAGVRVTGTLRMPKFALFAEPSLPDAEVLSYLVTGHALANASSGEAGVIARAALSLGADRAALVTSQLSNLFALDEFGINPGKTARASSIVAGKRLTPKLTVRSEFNPFERLWTFFLNYKLSPRWSVEAQTGAGQGADLIYSVERDSLSGADPLKRDPAPRPSSP
jgi:translocation and assembly module TamB